VWTFVSVHETTAFREAQEGEMAKNDSIRKSKSRIIASKKKQRNTKRYAGKKNERASRTNYVLEPHPEL
jgi:hypothetical protein